MLKSGEGGKQSQGAQRQADEKTDEARNRNCPLRVPGELTHSSEIEDRSGEGQQQQRNRERPGAGGVMVYGRHTDNYCVGEALEDGMCPRAAFLAGTWPEG